MKPNNRIYANYALLLITVAPILSFIILPLHQKEIQYQMKIKLEKEALQKIVLSEKNVHWIKPGKEIWAANKMFDIKSYTYEDGIYTFSGLFDEKETDIVKQLQKNLPDQNSSRNKILYQLIQLFQITFQDQQMETSILTNLCRVDFRFFNSPLLTQLLSIPAPPPKF